MDVPVFDTNNVAHFERIPFERYLSFVFPDGEPHSKSQIEAIREYYAKTPLPARATPGSAGYDFFLPHDVCIPDTTQHPLVIGSCVRAFIKRGWTLMLFPRSSLGMRHGMRIVNTVGIIDSDYYFAENGGHIMFKVQADEPFHMNAGERFAQGVFVPYGVTDFDRPLSHERVGGFGSTGA